MAGYPNRLSHSDLGGTKLDEKAVENPETEVSAQEWSTLTRQVAGLNLSVMSRAAVVAEYADPDFDLYYQGEAWNPDGALAHPVLAITGIGSYTWTFAASYPDEHGTLIPTVLRAPRVTSHKPISAFADRQIVHAWIDPGFPLVVQVRLWTPAGAGEDALFSLEVG